MSRKIKHTKKSKTIISTLLIIIAIVAIVKFIDSGFFNCEVVVVEGNQWIDAEEIKDVAQVPLGSSLFKIDIKKIEKRIESLPVVAELNIQREFPDTIYLSIKEREPAFIIATEDCFILSDIDGFYFREVQYIKDYDDILVLSGLEVDDNLKLGSRIENELLNTAALIFNEMWENYGHFFAEIDFSLGEDQIVMYTHEALMVKIGSANNLSQKMAVFKNFYEDRITNPNFNNIEYLDISFLGLPIVKYR